MSKCANRSPLRRILATAPGWSSKMTYQARRGSIRFQDPMSRPRRSAAERPQHEDRIGKPRAGHWPGPRTRSIARSRPAGSNRAGLVPQLPNHRRMNISSDRSNAQCAVLREGCTTSSPSRAAAQYATKRSSFYIKQAPSTVAPALRPGWSDLPDHRTSRRVRDRGRHHRHRTGCWSAGCRRGSHPVLPLQQPVR
jgi:hypothetical protein